MDIAIIPECYIDTNLIETIAPPQGKGYNHQKGCGTVTNVMKEQFSDAFAVGIIDKDKKQVDYLKEFTEVINDGALILHRHKTKHHYIIQISPAVEEFIVDSANQAGVSLADYSLPENLDHLKKESKQQNSKKDHRFRSLFKAIKNGGASNFLKLAHWVTYLRDNNYSVDLKQLQE